MRSQSEGTTQQGKEQPPRCTWRKGPTGWFVYGRHVELTEAMHGDRWVEVVTKAGAIHSVRIEHVARPNSDGYASAWPEGTYSTAPQKTVKLPTVMPRRRR